MNPAPNSKDSLFQRMFHRTASINPVTDATPTDFLHNTNGVLQIVKVGTKTITVSAAGSAYTDVVAHGLSTTPLVVVTVAPPNTPTSFFPVNYLIYGSATNFINMTTWTDATNAHFQVELGAGVGATYVGDYSFKYYILQETAN